MGQWRKHVGGRLEGNVVSWEGRYGWIEPATPFEHEETWRHGGRIYAHQDDTDGPLTIGARVSFSVYCDDKGLGACEVKVRGQGPMEQSLCFAPTVVVPPKKKTAAGQGVVVPLPPARKGTPTPAPKIAQKASKAEWRKASCSAAKKGGAPVVPPVMRPIEKTAIKVNLKANGGKGHEKGVQPPLASVVDVDPEPEVIEGKEERCDESAQNEAPEGNPNEKAPGQGGKSGGKGKSVSPELLAALGHGPLREKTTHAGVDTILRWASSEMQGWRPAMEDATCALVELPPPLNNVAMFGVFDGHGGGEVSKRVAAELPQVVVSCAEELLTTGKVKPGAMGELLERALLSALPTLDTVICQEGAEIGGPPDGHGLGPWGIQTCNNAFALMGSTAVVALLELDSNRRPRRVVVANCGDSRAALCRQGEVIQLSEDQKPEVQEERERIEAAGGHVAKVGPCFRVDGWGLNLSRALGDFHYKSRYDLPFEAQKVSCVPEVRTMELTDEDEFLLLGCDGVFELHDWKSAVDVTRSGLIAGKHLTEVVEDLCDASCSHNLFETQGSGGDNVSAMVVILR